MTPSSPDTLLPAFRRNGQVLLATLLGLGLLTLGYATWAFPDYIAYAPLLLLGTAAVIYLFAHPLANMAVVLFGFVTLTDYNPGLQITELLYGLYLISFLAHWFFTRIFLYQEQVLFSSTDKALAGLLVLVTCYIPIAFIFNGNPYGIFAEWRAFILLAFYFPVKETIKEHKHGTLIVLAAIGFIGLFVALRNFVNYREMILQATQVWQVARGRISTNDNLLMITSLYGLVLLVFANKWHHKAIAFGAFMLYFSGLILTQSRGYWLAFLVGASFLFLIADRQAKNRMLLLGTVGSVALLFIGIVFLQDYIVLVLSGLIERLGSLRTAGSTDISLINRFRESASVWSYIVHNPVLGYGMGVSYEFFDITRGVNETDAFIHNGYMAFWYKYGLVGLGLLLFVWLRSIRAGIHAYRTRTATAPVRLAGLIATSALTAFLLSCNTSNPFFLNDTLFAFALLMGIANGTDERARQEVA